MGKHLCLGRLPPKSGDLGCWSHIRASWVGGLILESRSAFRVVLGITW